MRTQSVLSSLLDIGDDVLTGGEVDEFCGAELLETHLALFVAAVDGDDAETHGLCILLCEGSKTATCTDNGYGLAWTGAGFFETSGRAVSMRG